MTCRLMMIAMLVLSGSACAGEEAAAWAGTGLERPRTQLTADQLAAGEILPLVDMSFFARPDWAGEAAQPFSGTVSLAQTRMEMGLTREPNETEDVFPAFSVDFATRDGKLVPSRRGLIDTGVDSGSVWNVIVGAGAVWQEEGDREWSRASFPLHLMDRVYGPVRNCVATFVYTETAMSNVSVQCSQETAGVHLQQLGDVRAMVPARYEPRPLAEAAGYLDDYERSLAGRIPVAPLGEIDSDGDIAAYFDKNRWTGASTSAGAVYLDGTLYVNPPMTRHGVYPYPEEMRHAIFSATKSLAGALAIFYFAERYGEEIFDEPVTDYVPALAARPEWQGATFSHVLNMVTGTRGGDEDDVFAKPLLAAQTSEEAIANIAGLGDADGAPGEVFHYAATNTFVLSYALQAYAEQREGEGVHYWDLVRENVLVPIGAENLPILTTRDVDVDERLPLLTVGASPTLDEAAKIARLFANGGEHEGTQILSRRRIREALGPTDWAGYLTNPETQVKKGERYRHSFRSIRVRAGFCRVEAVYMLGYGANDVVFLPSGAILLRFMDEMDYNIDPLVRAVERVKSSCR